MKHYDEVWAVPEERLRTYFESRLRDGGPGTAGLQVKLTRLQDLLLAGRPWPRVRVEITGEDAAAEQLHKDFLLTFLSAGG